MNSAACEQGLYRFWLARSHIGPSFYRTQCLFDYFVFFTHVSQYFSTRIIPLPTSNKASWVALTPQVTQILGFELEWLGLSSNALRRINFLFIFNSLPHKLSCYWRLNSGFYSSFLNLSPIPNKNPSFDYIVLNSKLHRL